MCCRGCSAGSWQLAKRDLNCVLQDRGQEGKMPEGFWAWGNSSTYIYIYIHLYICIVCKLMVLVHNMYQIHTCMKACQMKASQNLKPEAILILKRHTPRVPKPQATCSQKPAHCLPQLPTALKRHLSLTALNPKPCTERPRLAESESRERRP